MKLLTKTIYIIFSFHIVFSEVYDRYYYEVDYKLSQEDYSEEYWDDENSRPHITDVLPSPCSLEVSWTYDGSADNLTSFGILWREKDDGSNTTLQSDSVSPENFNYTIEDLNADTEYEIVVSSIVNEMEYNSDVASGSTLVGEPPNISYLGTSEVTSSTIRLDWNISSTECEVSSFKVEWDGIVLWDPTRTVSGSVTTEEQEYIMKNLVPSTNYTISVRAIASDETEGEKTSKFEVTKSKEPGPPRNLKSTSENSSVIQLSWEEPYELNGNLQEYVITWTLIPEGDEEGTANTTELSIPISDLLECGNYSFAVSAKNEAGVGEAVETSEETQPEKPSETISVNATEVSSMYANLTWEPPETNCPVLRYEILGFGVILWGEESLDKLNDTVEGSDTSYVVDLVPWTKYLLCVLSVTKGDFTTRDCLSLTTLQDVPSEPQEFEVKPESPTTASAAWKPPEEANGEILFYNLTWLSEEEEEWDFDITNDTSYFIEDLIPCTDYVFNVTAYTQVGQGSPGQDTVTLLPEASPPPKVEKCEVVNATTMVVTWGEPDTYCNVDMYKLEASGVVLWSGNSTFVSESTADLEYQLSDLYPFTMYNVSITGIIGDMEGESVSCENVTDEEVPGEPESLKEVSDSIEKKTFEVKWKAPTWRNGILLGFDVKCNDEKSYVDAVNDVQYTYSFECQNLKPKTDYTVSVSANTKAGYGPAAEITVETKSNALGITFGILICIIIIGALVGAGYIYRDQLQRKMQNLRTTTPSELTDASNSMVYTNPIPIHNFKTHINKLKTGHSLTSEFEALNSMSADGSTYEANKPENQLKNRYSNILPYDATRVTLYLGPSNYINANYINSFWRDKFFIAAQGPLDNTLEEFWTLVWQENIGVIVMLTSCFENGKEKCSQYWPDSLGNGVEICNLTIQTINEESTSSFLLRVLEVTSKNDNVKRLVKQYQFLVWPDFGAPSREEDLLRLVYTVKDNMERDRIRKKTLVHCSAGVGRTGTFICLWNVIEQIDNEAQSVSVFNEVLNLRKQRVLMVQSKEQYLYLNKCILEYLENKSRWQIQHRGPVMNNGSSSNREETQAVYDNQCFEMNQDFEGNLI